MGVVRFISDLHFGHHNMAIKRGFTDANEMDEYIIAKWNEVVTTKDVTYILGDITMEKKSLYPLLGRLKGIKYVILGNHDRRQDVEELLKWVDGVAGMVNYKGVILTHCPIHPCELDYRYSHNIHGHVHENSLPDERYVNVSCEVRNYTPKPLTELI
jgi:calcineurin-like phosphoesterase family protein